MLVNTKNVKNQKPLLKKKYFSLKICIFQKRNFDASLNKHEIHYSILKTHFFRRDKSAKIR